ncbi:MAG: SiaB family protein kinase [Candidatus Kapaibacteriales bacterium]
MDTANLDFDLYDYYQSTSDKKIIFAFKGIMSQNILEEIAEVVKLKIHLHKNAKKMFAVFVELTQNIMFYSQEREIDPDTDKEYGVGIIIFHKNDERYMITSGNICDSARALKIKDRIESLSKTTPEELKDIYKTVIREPRSVDSKGAGLGLIDIARKSDGKITCNIKDLGDGKSFIIISVKFDKREG